MAWSIRQIWVNPIKPGGPFCPSNLDESHLNWPMRKGHSSHRQTEMAQVSLCFCAVSPEPSFFAHTIRQWKNLQTKKHICLSSSFGHRFKVGRTLSVGCAVRLVFRRLRVRFSGPAPSFVKIWSWNNFYGHSLPSLIQVEQVSVTGESIGFSNS